MVRILPRRKRQPRTTPSRTFHPSPWLHARVRVDAVAFDALFRRLGYTTDAARSRFLNLPHSTFIRIYNGDKRPSPEFIGHAMSAFGAYGIGFDDLFLVEVDPADLKAVA